MQLLNALTSTYAAIMQLLNAWHSSTLGVAIGTHRVDRHVSYT